MSLTINTNVTSLIAQRNLYNNNTRVSKSLERLSSGYRINRAADDAAGLSISEGLRSQIRGTKQAVANAQDGINILQVAEGGLSVISENLQRIRELTVQAANDTYASAERDAIAQEVDARLDDIDRIAGSLRFNSITLLDGTASSFTLQIGPNASAQTNSLLVGNVLQTADVSALQISATQVTTGANGYFSAHTACRNFLTTLDNAISIVNSRRSLIGAYQNRLESTVESLSITTENLSATESKIRDLDIAAESANMTKNQILQQSALSVLAQANQGPSMALQLLG